MQLKLFKFEVSDFNMLRKFIPIRFTFVFFSVFVTTLHNFLVGVSNGKKGGKTVTEQQ